ncbi:AAA family ATPase [Lacipirellula sp.]|uniref:AAA family ATPase n=1 Tax=Lacipirellula sp. TaxID=2691419 RepID=UPI003D11244A
MRAVTDEEFLARVCKTRRRLAGIVGTFSTVRLPGEMGSKQDLRDVLAKPNGRQLVQQAIDARAAAVSLDFPRFTLAELTESFRTLSPPVIHGLIRTGETANFIANPKVGKSWAMYGLAINVATGTEWLGLFAVSQGRVLIVDNELHPQTLAHRIPSVGDAMGFPFEEYRDGIDTWCLRGNLRSLQELLITFRQMVKRSEYKLIIFDAKYRFAAQGASENDNAAETLVYNLLDQIAAETESALIVVHHMSKGSQSDKRVTDVGAGAGAQSRAADCHMVLREHEDEGVLVLDAAVRSFPPVAPVALRWSFPVFRPDEWADAGKLKGRMAPNEQRAAERDKEGCTAICDALLAEPMTPRQLRGKTGISKDRQDRLLDKLESEGHVTFTSTIVRGNESRLYRLSGEGFEDVVDYSPTTSPTG